MYETIIASLVAAATGPSGAIAVLLLILGAAYHAIIKHAIPIMKKYLEGQNKHLEILMEEHKADREAYLLGISTVNARLDKIDGKLEDIEERLPTKK